MSLRQCNIYNVSIFKIVNTYPSKIQEGHHISNLFLLNLNNKKNNISMTVLCMLPCFLLSNSFQTYIYIYIECNI